MTPSNTAQRLTVPSSVSSNLASQSHKRLDSQRPPSEKPEKRVLAADVISSWNLSSEPLQSDELNSIVGILTEEFPLLDEPLIRAIISDHTPDQLYSKLNEIRDNLGMLQATAIPDIDDHPYYDTASQVNPNELKSEHARLQDDAETNSDMSIRMQSLSLEGNVPSAHAPDTSIPLETDQAVSTEVIDSVQSEKMETGSPGIEIKSSIPENDDESELYDSDMGHDAEMWLEENLSREGFGPVDFVYEMFGHLPRSEIERAIQTYDLESGGDLSLAIEDLLSFETVKQLQEPFQTHSHSSEQTRSYSSTEAGDQDWANFFIKVDPSLQGLQEEKQPVPEPRTRKSKKAKTKSSPFRKLSHDGPRPNDQAFLPLNTQLYSSIKAKSSSASVTSDAESVDEHIPGTPRIRSVKPLANPGRYAALATEGQSGFSSGDESVGSVRARRTSARTSRAVPLRDFERANHGTAIPPRNGPGDSTWGTINSLATYLAELVEQPSADVSYFLTFFHSPQYGSGYEAVKSGLRKAGTPLAQSKAELQMVLEIRNGLEESSAIHTSNEDVEICVAAARHVAAALDLLALLEEIKTWGGGSLDGLRWTRDSNETNVHFNPPAIRPAPPERPLAESSKLALQRTFPPEPHTIKRKKKDEHPQNWRTVTREKVKKPGSSHRLAEFIPGYARGAFGNDVTMFDLDECRRRAVEERLKREAAIRQAGRHFRNGTGGGNRGRQVAAFYAGEARRYEQAARSWELRAAQELVTQQSRSDPAFSVDLHGLTLDEAKLVAVDRVRTWHASQNFAPTPAKPFQLITGQGKHSVNHVGVLGPGLSNELERQGWKVDRGYNGRGYIVVRGIKGG